MVHPRLNCSRTTSARKRKPACAAYQKLAPAIATIVATAAFFLVCAGLIQRTVSLSTDPTGRGQRVMQDFRDAVYYPVVALLDGNNPYDKPDYLAKYPVSKHFPPYSPLALIVHLPFAALPFPVAQTTYVVVTLALALVLAHASLALAGIPFKPPLVLALGALLVSSRAAQTNFEFGQSALQFALATIAALHFARRRPWLSALGLAFVTIKIQYAVPLVVWMLARRDYAVVARGIGIGAIGALAGAVLLAASCGSIDAVVDAGSAALSRSVAQHVAPLPIRIDTPAVLTFVTHRGLRWRGTLAILAVFLVGIGAVLRRTADREAAYATGLAGYDLSAVLICLAILSVGYHQLYDALLLAPAIVALLAAWREPWRSVPAGARWAMGVAMAVPVFNYTSGRQAMAYRGSLLEPLSRPAVNGIAIQLALALCIWACLRLRPRYGDDGASV